MKKRIVTAIAAALLVVSMTVTVFAAESNSGSKAATNATTTPTYTTPNGQPITDQLIEELAEVTENSEGVERVSKNTVAAVSNYLKAIGSNAALVASFKDNTPPGETTIKCSAIYAGVDYSVIIQFADGRVVVIKPKKTMNGKLLYDKPAGAIASISVAANASAPR